MNIGNRGSLSGEQVSYKGEIYIENDVNTKLRIKFKNGIRCSVYIIHINTN